MLATATPRAARPAAATPTVDTTTESVVRNHLTAFLQQKGVAAIVADYDPAARLHGPDGVYEGQAEIARFFDAFIAALPAGAYERFALGTLRVDGELAFITWSIGDDVPLGTDTFIVRGGRIVRQTFAMHATPSR